MSVEARVWSCCKQTGLVILVFGLAGVCRAQQPAAMNAQVQLLDHLAGNWVLQGTIAGKPTTHDVQAEWVLNREYLLLREDRTVDGAKNEGAGWWQT